jgi:hypothetical protein
MTPNNIERGVTAFDDPSLALEMGGTEPAVEIEIAAPEDTTIIELDDGGMEITFGEEDEDDKSFDTFDANLAEHMDDNDLHVLGSDLEQFIDQDKRSRDDWEKMYRDGIKLLGLKTEERTQPWLGACSITHPMVTEAVVRFQSEMINETFPAKGPVLTKVLGKETREKMQAALRVQHEMNHQLTDAMPEFRDEHERMLFNLPWVGSAFKKVFKDETLGRQVSLYVGAEDIILPYGTTNIRVAPRITHVLRKSKDELLELMETGFYRVVDLGSPDKQLDEVKEEQDKQVGVSDADDEAYTLYECHAKLVIERDARKGERVEGMLPRPYIVTMLRGGQVLSIRRNWDEADRLEQTKQYFVHYQYVPGFGAYGLGLVHLIGGYAQGATGMLRQLVDAGTLANLQGGFKTRGLRIKGDDTPIPPGTWRDVDVASGTLKDNILPLPYKEPSVVLAGLLEKVVEDGRRLAGVMELKVSDMSAQAPVGTTLALIERQLVVLTAVQARTHYSLKQELQLIKNIIRDELDEDYSYEPTHGSARAKAGDFALVEVVPVSDPNAATLTQRLVQYQAVIQLSQTAPQIYDLPLLHRGMLETLGVKNAEKLVPLPEDLKPMDPVTENMRVLKGEPVKAFLYQDHEAHIATHTAALQDPMLMQLLGQNPKAQQLMAAAQAHIAEHAGFDYRQRIELELGVQLPPPEDEMPPEIEAAMSQLMAKAAGQVLAKNQAAAQAQQAQQQQQDPVLQLQMREMGIKEAAQKLQERKQQFEEQLAQIRLQLEAAAKADKQGLDEQKFQLSAAMQGDQQSLAEQKLQADAAAQADKQELAERKQTADEELAEQRNRLQLFHYGMMGRAQDQQILQGDRDRAMELLRLMQQRHDSNDLGESGNDQ